MEIYCSLQADNVYIYIYIYMWRYCTDDDRPVPPLPTPARVPPDGVPFLPCARAQVERWCSPCLVAFFVCNHGVREAASSYISPAISEELPASCTLRDADMGGAREFVRTHFIQQPGPNLQHDVTSGTSKQMWVDCTRSFGEQGWPC